jgi:TolB protein
MKIKTILASLSVLSVGAIFLAAQEQIVGKVDTNKQKPKVAVIDFRGAGDAQKFMAPFNTTLWDELSNSGAIIMVGKSFYPLEVPQQPQDFKPPTTAAPARRGDPPRTVKNGPWLTDWSGPPTNANYLVFGYTAVQDGRLLLRGYLFNVGQPDVASAQLIGKLYFGSLDEDGAKKVAREFAADILQQFGQKSLSGSKIYLCPDRTRQQRNLVHGLRWIESEADDSLRDHLEGADCLGRRKDVRIYQPDQRILANYGPFGRNGKKIALLQSGFVHH